MIAAITCAAVQAWLATRSTGLQVMAAIMEADVTAACGPKGRHDAERTATRHGHGAGSVSLGGRRVPVPTAADARGRRLG